MDHPDSVEGVFEPMSLIARDQHRKRFPELLPEPEYDCPKCHDSGWILRYNEDLPIPLVMQIGPCSQPGCKNSGKKEIMSLSFPDQDFTLVITAPNGRIMSLAIDPWVVCPNCRGMERQLDGEPCPRCEGSGKVRKSTLTLTEF